MQKLKLIIKCFVFSLFVISISSCEKKYGDTFDFSNSLAPYVELSSKTGVTVKEGANLTSTVQIRTTLQEDVTVGYTISGGYTKTGTVVIPKNKVSIIITEAIPTGTVPVSDPSVAAVLTLTSVSTPSGKSFIIGRLGADKEKRNVTITK